MGVGGVSEDPKRAQLAPSASRAGESGLKAARNGVRGHGGGGDAHIKTPKRSPVCAESLKLYPILPINK